MEKFTTLPQMIQATMNQYHNATHLNHLYLGKWENISSGAFVDMVRRLSLGLSGLGLKKGEGVGILADPSPFWLMMDLAVMIAGGISVPMFPNISPANLEFEIGNSNMKFLYMAKDERWEAIRARMKSFNKIISQSLEFTGPNIVNFVDILNQGDQISKKDPDRFTLLSNAVHEDDIATIIYTSGSTGMPKGVEITHKNLVSQIQGSCDRFPLKPAEDTLLSCLPLAHIFERMVMYYYISTGCSIYFADDIKRVGDLLREIRPTVMTMVPRLLEKVYAKMFANARATRGLKGEIAKMALSRAARLPFEGRKRGLVDLIFDRLVYSKLRAAMGGRLRQVIVGGAPLSKEIGGFFLNVGVPLYEGYGQTEASPVIATNYPGHRRLGTVGPAFPAMDIRIAQDGEILARGPNIMRGYHHNEEATKAALDSEGWLHTGDRGELDQDGYLKITGRIKELFKTSSGKYVSPLPIEQALCRHEFVDMACVIAEGRNFVTCLLFPNFENLPNIKAASGFGYLNDGEFLESDYIHQELSALLSAINKDLNHWEKVQKYRIIKKPVSPETDDLTPSFKLRRHIVAEHYASLIDDMYREAKIDPMT
jgi:long-chain acyl-CoA synthetase